MQSSGLLVDLLVDLSLTGGGGGGGGVLQSPENPPLATALQHSTQMQATRCGCMHACNRPHIMIFTTKHPHNNMYVVEL